MNAVEIKKALLAALAHAEERDEAEAARSTKYAEDLDERLLKRSQTVLTYLAIEFDDKEPSLYQALDKFLDLDALFVKTNEARLRNKQLAGGETFKSPAPGVTR